MTHCLTGVVSRIVRAVILSAYHMPFAGRVQIILSTLFSLVEQHGTMPHICPTSRWASVPLTFYILSVKFPFNFATRA
jgi:hypothetical protein